MINKPLSRQLTTIGLLAILNPAQPVADQPDRLFEPAEQDAKGRFINMDKDESEVSIKVRAPFFMRRVASSFISKPGAPTRVPNDGAYLRDNAMHSEPTTTWIGHATLLVQMEHLTFLTDPIWSNTPSPIPFAGPNRFVKPGIALDDLPAIDFVIISHNHYDHLDLPTLRKLAKRNPETIFFVPIGNGKLLRKMLLVRFRKWTGAILSVIKLPLSIVCQPSIGANAASQILAKPCGHLGPSLDHSGAFSLPAIRVTTLVLRRSVRNLGPLT